MTSSNDAPTDRIGPRKARASRKSSRSATAPARPSRPARSPAPPILPGEDARAYRDRLKAWTGSLEPRNAIEAYLVERAVLLSWRLDRADRAQIERLAALAGAEGAPGDPAASSPFDESESGERLRRYQIACDRALSRTLHTFARIRELDESRQMTIPLPGPDDPAAPIDDDPPPTIAAPDALDLAELGAILHDEVAAALAGMLAAIDAGELCPVTDLAMAVESQTAPAHASRDRPEDDDPSASPHRTGSPRPRREPGARDRQPGWPQGRHTSPNAPRSAEAGSGPNGRVRPWPDDTADPAGSRRRVGGYEVPLDPSVPVSCADRIPVRLRREAAGNRPG